MIKLQYNRNKLFILFSAAFLSLAIHSLTYSDSEPLKEYVIALKPDKNPDRMLEERKALESFLSKRLNKPVKVIVPLSSAVILEGLSNKTIDAAFIASVDMIQAQKRDIAQILLASEIKGKTSYESYWLTLKNKPYKNISDLKGKPVAFASRTSTSGFLMPLAALVKRNLIAKNGKAEDFFGKNNIFYGTGYVSAIEQVLSGNAEAAAVSDYVFIGTQHLSQEQKDKLKILDTQGPVPTHMIAARSSLKEEDSKALFNAFSYLNEKKWLSLRDKIFNAKLVKVNTLDHLKSTVEALELTGVTL